MKRTPFIDLDRMRKSRSRPLLKPLVAAIAGASLVSCGSSEEVRIFSSIEECKGALPDQVESCEAAYQTALEESQRTAPKYPSRSDCEYEFGQNACVPYTNNSGGGWFMPAMAGFMLGQALNRGDRDYYRGSPIYSSSSYSSPLRGKFVLSDGSVIGNAGDRRARVSSDALKPKPATTTTMSRGGFGSTAVAKSSWGSSKGGWGG